MIESELVAALLNNLSERSKEDHNVKILRLVREVMEVPLDRAVEMFECLQYDFAKYVCTQPGSSLEDERHFYEMVNEKTC